MITIVKLKHSSGSTAVDLTKIISVSYWEARDRTEILLEGGLEIEIPGNFLNQLCSLITMVEAEDE